MPNGGKAFFMRYFYSWDEIHVKMPEDEFVKIWVTGAYDGSPKLRIIMSFLFWKVGYQNNRNIVTDNNIVQIQVETEHGD